MATLLLRLQGPMQSWGTISRFDERYSQFEPSKSGVLGLVCAALGRDRSKPIDDLTSLMMGVRVDREGVMLCDFQTATGVVSASGTIDKKRTVVSPRYYLSNAVFLVGLEGDSLLLSAIHKALFKPYWPLFLGRKSYIPSPPVYLSDGLMSEGLRRSLTIYPSLVEMSENHARRLIIESSDKKGTIRLDQPVAPFIERKFSARFVITDYLETEHYHVPD